MEKEKNIYQKLFEVKKAWIKLQRDTTAFNYKYATLSQIQEKFSNVLQEQWLLVIHFAQLDYMVTQIVDTETKESIESRIAMTEWTKPQDKGSEITYYRRYNLLSLLDLEVEDDDWKKAQDSKVEKEVELSWIDDKVIDKISTNIADTWEFPSIKDIRKHYKVSKANATRLEAMGVK